MRHPGENTTRTAKLSGRKLYCSRPAMKSYRALRTVLAFVPAVPNWRGQATAVLHPGRSGAGSEDSVELRFGSLTKAAHFYAICERAVYT